MSRGAWTLLRALAECSDTCACTAGDFALPQVAAGDLDVAIVRQLATPQSPLDYTLEMGPLEVVSLDAPLGRDGAVDKPAEQGPRNADDALILTYADAELDDLPVGVPAGILGKAEEHGMPRGVEGVPILFFSRMVEDAYRVERLVDDHGPAAV